MRKLTISTIAETMLQSIQVAGRAAAGKESIPMKGTTTIQERLWDLRRDKGLKLEELAAATGISKSALGSYEKDENKEINHGSLIILADFYGVSIDYLLCRTENREQANTPLTELHLSDAMVDLLKSGRINNRLLCEIAMHEVFVILMTDTEIYVDGVDTMHFGFFRVTTVITGLLPIRFLLPCGLQDCIRWRLEIPRNTTPRLLLLACPQSQNTPKPLFSRQGQRSDHP